MEAGGTDSGFVPVKERFAKAKRDQQQKEAEKLEKIRVNRANKPAVDTSSAGIDSLRRITHLFYCLITYSLLLIENDDGELSPNTPKKSVSTRWAQTLEESKTNELNKFSSKKKSTLEAFQITKGGDKLFISLTYIHMLTQLINQGTGIVKRHIDKWEDLFMQINITATQLKATFEAAIIKAKRKNEENEALRLSLSQSITEESLGERAAINLEDYELNSEPEMIVNGSTLLYDRGSFGNKTNSILEANLLKNENKPIPLPCGMYSGDNRSPPISIVAVGTHLLIQLFTHYHTYSLLYPYSYRHDRK